MGGSLWMRPKLPSFRTLKELFGGSHEGLEWLRSLQPSRGEVDEVLPVARAVGTAFNQPSASRPSPSPWRPPTPRPLLGQQFRQVSEQRSIFGEVVLPGANHSLLAAAAQLAAHGSGASVVEFTDCAFERRAPRTSAGSPEAGSRRHTGHQTELGSQGVAGSCRPSAYRR